MATNVAAADEWTCAGHAPLILGPATFWDKVDADCRAQRIADGRSVRLKRPGLNSRRSNRRSINISVGPSPMEMKQVHRFGTSRASLLEAWAN